MGCSFAEVVARIAASAVELSLDLEVESSLHLDSCCSDWASGWTRGSGGLQPSGLQPSGLQPCASPAPPLQVPVQHAPPAPAAPPPRARPRLPPAAPCAARPPCPYLLHPEPCS